MFVKRHAEAPAYEAPNHRGVLSVRLQGFEAAGTGGPQNQWVGLSNFEPGGGAGPDSTPFEKVYVVLDGEMTVMCGGREVTLKRFDSCTIAAGEVREIVNKGSTACQMLVVIPYPPGYVAPGTSPEDIATAAFARPGSVFDVKGKVAIVTGASGAFGAVAAKVLAGAGAKVVLTAGKKADLEAVSEIARKLGAEVLALNVRPDSEASCDVIVQRAVQRFDRVDILVVASGKNDVAKIQDMAPSRFLDVMDANVTQSWLMARAVARQMLKQGEAGQGGGKIVLMSSARGLLGHPAGYTAYCASKSAVDGITKALGCELGPSGITVNAIAPTVFRSPLTQWMFEDNDNALAVRKGFLARVPKGRLGEPGDLAGPLLFLASNASDFYTGHILYADGGYTAG